MKNKLIETENYTTLHGEVEKGLGIEVFRIWNTYHDLSRENKVKILKNVIDWSTEELKWNTLNINSTKSNADMNIGIQTYTETIEEAAEKYIAEDNNNKYYKDFIQGAKSDAARDYWFEQFKNK